MAFARRGDFRQRDLSSTAFYAWEFRACDFSGSNLTGCTFMFCDFSGADFTNAVVSGVVFRHCREETPAAEQLGNTWNAKVGRIKDIVVQR